MKCNLRVVWVPAFAGMTLREGTNRQSQKRRVIPTCAQFAVVLAAACLFVCVLCAEPAVGCRRNLRHPAPHASDAALLPDGTQFIEGEVVEEIDLYPSLPPDMRGREHMTARKVRKVRITNVLKGNMMPGSLAYVYYSNVCDDIFLGSELRQLYILIPAGDDELAFNGLLNFVPRGSDIWSVLDRDDIEGIKQSMARRSKENSQQPGSQ